MSAQDLNEILQVRREKLAALKQAGEDPFEVTTFEVDAHCAPIAADFEAYEGKQVRIAGRMIAKRIMGKAMFLDVLDKSGKIQVYVRINTLGEAAFVKAGKLDIGDIIGVAGEVFRTRRGEISIKAESIKLLSKSLRPLPEKWHGLKDPDLRYRQRYVDLIVNPEVMEVFKKRSAIIKEMRACLDERGFLEVETPILNVIPGGANARPFITHHNTLDIDMYLRIAPELFLKRLIVGGMERVYEIGRTFRNEGMSVKHNPEFTIIELYQAFTDYNGMMEIAETLISRAAMAACGTTRITYQGVEIDLTPPFEKISMHDVVKKYAGIDFKEISSSEQAYQALKQAGIEAEEGITVGDALNLAFEQRCEEKLISPTFIIDYPVEISPLTKRKPSNPALTERFELFIMGREMGNAYTELNDPIDQAERFRYQMMLREQGDDEAQIIDEDFVNALEYGMPPTGGLGMGIDRLVMLLCDCASIRDVLLFPTMKPLAPNGK